MVLKLTRWNRFFYITHDLEKQITETLEEAYHDQIAGCPVGFFIEGGTYFPNILKKDGKTHSTLVEVSYEKVAKDSYSGGIVNVWISDEEMPNEFLDRINYWRERFKAPDCIATNPDNFKKKGDWINTKTDTDKNP